MILGVALVAAGLGAWGTWYLNTVFLPGPARQHIGAWLAEQTGRKIQLGTLTFRIWRGVTIDHLIIYEDRRDGEQPCLELDRVTFSFRQLIIPTLRLDHPRLRLARNRDGIWNVESLRCWPRRNTTTGAAGPLHLLVPRLIISNGELLIEDNAAEPGFDATLTRLELRAAVRLPHTVEVKGTAQWQTTPVTPLLVRGTWDLPSHTGRWSLAARQLPLEALLPYLPSSVTGTLRELAGAATVTLRGANEPDQLDLTLSAASDACRWDVGHGFHGTGTIAAVVQARARRTDGWAWRFLGGSVQCRETTVQPPAPWPAVEQLAGLVQITPDKVHAAELSAVVRGLPIRAQATLTRAALDARAEYHGPLDDLWRATAAERRGVCATAELRGRGAATVVVHGPWGSLEPTATLRIEDGSLAWPTWPPAEHVQGRVLIEPNVLTVTDLRATWQGQPLTLDGTLVNFSQPEINGSGTWGDWSADAALAIDGARVSLTSVETTYRHSRATVTGEIITGSDDPVGTLYSELVLNLADLPAGSPLQGTFKGQAFLQGPLRRPDAWECGLKGRVGTLACSGWRAENVSGEYRQRQGEATISSVTALCYGGTLTGSGTARLDQPGRPFTAQVALQNAELGRALKDRPWNTQEVSGLLSGQWSLAGRLGALPASLSGQGRIQVTNGRLFELPLLRGMADVLGAPALRHVTFREAAGTFTLRDEQLRSSDLTFYGDLATLTATGTIGPAGALDANVVASIDPTAFEHSPDLARQAGQFLHKAGYLIGQIRVGGTLAEPHYEMVPQQVFQRLRGLIGGIFQ